MNTSAEIESIVRRVLKGMLAGNSLPAPDATISATDSASILRLKHSLITLASLPRDLKSIREVHIPRRGVITPAVCDLLRNSNVSIVRGKLSEAKNSAVGNVYEDASVSSVMSIPDLLVAGNASYMTALNRTICPRQAKVMPNANDDAAALREIAVGLRSGHRAAVIIGTSAHSIAWQAARDEKLRPIVVGQWTQLAEAIAEVPANLVILSNKYWNAPGATNVIRAFYKHLTQS